MDSGYRGNSSGREDAGAQGIHLLLRPPDLLAPSLPPPLPPLTPPTPPWDQAFLEGPWGSGDYLETLSFLVPEGEELALATPLPDHEGDGGDWFSYNYAFPARPTLPLSSRLPLTPTASAPAHSLHPQPDVFPSWDEDYELEELVPLEPTEALLPDMNSLEYYTNLLARERARQPPPQPHPSITPTPALAPPPSSSPPEQDSTSTQTPTSPPTSTPKGDPPDPVRHPGSPPSNTTRHTPSSPPPGPPARPPHTPTSTTSRSPPGRGSTTQITAISLTRAPPVTTPRAAQAPPTRQYLCNVTKPEMYLVRVGKTAEVGGAGADLRPAHPCLSLQSAPEVLLRVSARSKIF